MYKITELNNKVNLVYYNQVVKSFEGPTARLDARKFMQRHHYESIKCVTVAV